MTDLAAYAAFFCIGFLQSVVIATFVNLYGWRKGEKFFMNPPFSLDPIQIFVRVTWENPKFVAWLLLLKIIWVVCVVATAYVAVSQHLVSLYAVLAFAAGALIVGGVNPPLGNIAIGALDYFEVKPRGKVLASSPLDRPADIGSDGRKRITWRFSGTGRFGTDQVQPAEHAHPDTKTDGSKRDATPPLPSQGRGGWRRGK